jgi:hypothetical protein
MSEHNTNGALADVPRIGKRIAPPPIEQATPPVPLITVPRVEVFALHTLQSDLSLLEPPEPIAPPICYAQRVTLLSGREKSGKSTLLANAAAAVSAGTEFLGTSLSARRVLWFALDEWRGDAVRRFTDLGADKHRLDLAFEVPSATQLDLILADGGYGLVCIDTLNELLMGVNLNQSNEVLPRMRPYIEVIRRHNAAGCIVAHASKGRGEYIGSVTIGGAVDAPLTLEDPRKNRDKSSPAEAEADKAVPDTGVRLLHGNTRFGPKLHEWVSAPDGLHYSRGKNAMSVEARILRELSERDAANNEELAKRMGMRKDVVGKAVKELRTQGRIASGERGLSLVLGLVPG